MAMTTGTEGPKTEKNAERSMPRLRSVAQSEQRNEALGMPPKFGSGDPTDGPPPDWLEPLDDFKEEEEEEEEEDGGQGFHIGHKNDSTARDVLKRTHHDGLAVSRQKRAHAGLDDLWTDWPTLGKGWKRREVYRNCGTRTDTYYMSPDGVRLRSKVELAKHVHHTDLSRFAFKTGLFLKKTKSKQRPSVSNPENGIVLGPTTPSERPVTPTAQPGPPHSITEICLSTPQRPNPNLKPGSDPPRPASNFDSPPHLTPVSPVVRRSNRSPALHPGALSPFTTAGKLASDALLPQTWLHPVLEPVSPAPSPKEEDRPAPPNGQTLVKAPPMFPSPPVTQRSMDPDMVLTDNSPPSELGPVISDCANCGGAFPAEGNDELCSSCASLKKLTSPNRSIVFKKIGHGKWVLAKPPHLTPEKKAKNTEREKRSHSWNSKKLLKPKFKKRPQSSDSEDYDGNAAESWVQKTKKRQRRMCFKCEACLRQDCGKCDYCKDKPKFGGLNKKKQKCRKRQCLYEAREMKYRIPHRTTGPHPSHQSEKKPTFREYTKPTRPLSKRPHKRPAWEEDYTDPEDDKGKRQRRRGDSVERDEEDGDEEDGDEEDGDEEDGDEDDRDEDDRDEDDEDYGLFELEQNDDTTNDYISGAVNTEEMSTHTLPIVFQNGNLQVNSIYQQTTQGPVIVYSLAGPAGGAVGLGEDVQIVRVNMGAPVGEDPLDFPPIMSEIFSLADGSEPLEGSGELELQHLLGTLRRTVLPAHWMAVLAKGPALQLLQCSRRSPMADALLQIEPGLCYGLSVQGQPLPPAHPVYERHPPHLTSVSLVVELLLDLEGMAVCQGYPWGSALVVRPCTNEAVLCVRDAFCQLLVDPVEEGERCHRCHPPSSDV